MRHDGRQTYEERLLSNICREWYFPRSVNSGRWFGRCGSGGLGACPVTRQTLAGHLSRHFFRVNKTAIERKWCAWSGGTLMVNARVRHFDAVMSVATQRPSSKTRRIVPSLAKPGRRGYSPFGERSACNIVFPFAHSRRPQTDLFCFLQV